MRRLGDFDKGYDVQEFIRGVPGDEIDAACRAKHLGSALRLFVMPLPVAKAMPSRSKSAS